MQVCSNGFIVDTQPPVGGQVWPESGQVLADHTGALISWQGFHDIEADMALSGGRMGIKEYYYGLGE